MITIVCAGESVGMRNRDAGILLGVPIDRKSLVDMVQESVNAVEHRSSQSVFACVNPHSLVVAQHDQVFRSALTVSDLVVADGVGVTMMARVAGVEIGPRITGSDYFYGVLNALQQRRSGRVFFFGSSQQVLDRIAKRFSTEFPSLTLCGVLSPPFGSWNEIENHLMVNAINEAKPDVLWVGMTAPKQEKWVEANRRQLNVPVIGSIGAVFDFYAGTYSRAPKWICDIGLEWVYRFIHEPRRMWRRNCVSAPKFVWLVIFRHIFRSGVTTGATDLSSREESAHHGEKVA